MNTLRGVFPEPPSMPRRNFIKENMIKLKKMQGFTVTDAGDHLLLKKQNKQIENEEKTMKLIKSTRKQLQTFSQMSNSTDAPTKNTKPSQTINSGNVYRKQYYHDYNAKTAVENYRELERRNKVRDTAVQTDTGVFRQSRPTEMNAYRQPRNLGDGDKSKMNKQPMYEEKRDYVKDNASVITNKRQNSNDPTQPPSTYQRGVVPKYLRDRKEELYRTHQPFSGDERCPDGHVVLPDSERKETLRMLRQSYSELVSELNQLPVRSDTLKIRNRKIEIENQLKKLDEGIRVFTRPKVYVKVGA